jgi:hypothetical protein
MRTKFPFYRLSLFHPQRLSAFQRHSHYFNLQSIFRELRQHKMNQPTDEDPRLVWVDCEVPKTPQTPEAHKNSPYLGHVVMVDDWIDSWNGQDH